MKALVLLSGGIDSTTCLALAVQRYGKENVRAISVDYNQRHIKELESACAVSLHYDVEWEKIKGPQDFVSMLNDPTQEVPSASYDELPEGVSPTYVPFRNGVMLSLMAAHAQMWSNELAQDGPEARKAFPAEHDHITIYFGAHAEDAHNWAYPDCTPSH